jgi:hypothetical protein
MKKHASFAQPLAGGEHPYTKKNLVFFQYQPLRQNHALVHAL